MPDEFSMRMNTVHRYITVMAVPVKRKIGMNGQVKREGVKRDEAHGGRGQATVGMTSPPPGVNPIMNKVMTISLKPDVQKFVEEKVRNGQFSSSEEAVNALLWRVREQEALTD